MKLGINDTLEGNPSKVFTLRKLLQNMLPVEVTDAVLQKIARTCCRLLGLPEKCSCEHTALESDAWLSWPGHKLAKIVSRMAMRVRKRFRALQLQSVPA